ncbi:MULTISPECIES: hypothetical protein [unclassified Methylobacterium]|jgi:hypothetical protein|uniref:hypothetical protein n=1 Tax=unclassified Methylobacterium TaxID=2615210 RepID=UPI001354282E|nr:hypothetical protein [Methylobacterium sp. 2A]MWV23899.1 hypothetical protein [Methylobacterium sp. 2A]
MFTKTARTCLAAALAVGGLAVAAPAMAAPLGIDAGLHRGAGDVVTVQYGYGYGPRHHGWRGHGGFGPRHHGWGRGHHYGWGHRGFGPRHHHHGGWGHRHGYGRW